MGLMAGVAPARTAEAKETNQLAAGGRSVCSHSRHRQLYHVGVESECRSGSPTTTANHMMGCHACHPRRLVAFNFNKLFT